MAPRAAPGRGRYLGHAGTTVSDRNRHRLRGQLESGAALLDRYLQGEAAPVIPLPVSGARAASMLKVVQLAAQVIQTHQWSLG